MARGPTKSAGVKQVKTLTHEGAARKNIPTAEYQSLAEKMEAIDPVAPVHYPRATPLAEGETRERDEDHDPQIIWKGMRIRLSKEQIKQLTEKGEVEIGEAQLVWKGKDRQDWSDLVVQSPMIFTQEKVHPKAIVDDLVRRTKEAAAEKDDAPDLFADFNGLTDPEARTDFYQHDQHWSNRMVLGDSLQVMASLAERENLRGQVQCIYFDPPYGIKFNSNWQVSTRSTKVDDKKQVDISREPEQVKAFRDTWKEGIHSYLTYLRDRLTVAHDLLCDSGSVFLQIGDENVHRVRSVLDEVFGSENFISLISYRTSVGLGATLVDNVTNFLIWYARNKEVVKYRPLVRPVQAGEEGASRYKRIVFPDGQIRAARPEEMEYPKGIENDGQLFRDQGLTSRTGSDATAFPVIFHGTKYTANSGGWRTGQVGMTRVMRASRLLQTGATLSYEKRYLDFPFVSQPNFWEDVSGGITSRSDPKIYVVQTSNAIVQRCILMSSDPGDLVLDPTCGSGTTAVVAEQWGRRWITIDTSRVALALARTRLMSVRYPYYLLADTPEGRAKEQDVSGKIQPDAKSLADIRQGFVYERAPHITLKGIANNSQIDEIWEKWQGTLEPLLKALNKALGRNAPWEEWDVPREPGDPWKPEAAAIHAKLREAIAEDDIGKKSQKALESLNAMLVRAYTFKSLLEKPIDLWTNAAAIKVHGQWWEARIARQKEIDASIAKAADVELLYDRPYEDKSRVRVAGPFTVESLSPHRVLHADEEELIDELDAMEGKRARKLESAPPTDFAAMVLEHLRSAGVHQSEKRDTIRFTSLQPWPGEYIGARGNFMEGEVERQAGIFIGPEFGTMTRVDLVAAAREATDARVDVLIACAFNFDAHASELTKLGPLPILKAKMNPDLHMAEDLKNTGKGNLFVVFGEPDIEISSDRDGKLVVKVNGIDVFDPNTGEIRSGDTKSIAAWFIDTDYNEESFFVRHAYFLGANDPYKSLKTALQAEIDKDAWETLYRDESRPFARPATGKIAVKVINHFGDEVMKVFRV